MDRMMICYKVKPDQVERHLKLLRAVYQELASTEPDNLHWATFQLEDEVSFVDFVTGDDLPEPLPELETFQRFRANLEERCDERVVTEINEIGSFRFP